MNMAYCRFQNTLIALRTALAQQGEQQPDELLERACSAAAAEGNRRGVKSTDALAIVAAFRNASAAPAA